MQHFVWLQLVSLGLAVCLACGDAGCQFFFHIQTFLELLDRLLHYYETNCKWENLWN